MTKKEEAIGDRLWAMDERLCASGKRLWEDEGYRLLAIVDGLNLEKKCD